MIEKKISNEAWYDALYGAARPRVYHYIVQLTREKTLSEDLTQEVFKTLWENIEKVREHPNPIGWLLVTAQHKVENEEKKAYRQREIALVEENLMAPEPETESDFLAGIPESMTDREKKLLLDRIYYQYPFKEIGKFLKCSGPTAQVRYGRTVNRLKKLLEGTL